MIDFFRLSVDDRNSYATVRDRFEAYFVKERKILIDRVRFFKEDKKKEGQFHFLSMTYLPWLNIATLEPYMMI